LYESSSEIGGQLNMAKVIPGKEEFHEMLRYFSRQVELTGVTLHLNTVAEPATLSGFDEVIVATGVTPRNPKIPGQDSPSVLTYIDVLKHRQPVGRRVAIIGAGGIGFDVAEYLASDGESTTEDLSAWLAEWGVEDPSVARGGVVQAAPERADREIYLLQRSEGKPGAGLGKTTGWIHRANLKKAGVLMVNGVSYQEITDEGLRVAYKTDQSEEVLGVDTIVLCAGQEPRRDLYDQLRDVNTSTVHVIGGAHEASELDAKRAINQAARLAAQI
jgi:2,4-dienoyl-CoA reductase (NADPH2)